MRNISKLFLTCGIALSTIPMAYADLTVTNNTKVVATANASTSDFEHRGLCSSTLGDSGKIKPSDSITIPGWVVNAVCFPDCEVYVYMSNNCEESHKIATVPVSPISGIGTPTNDPNAEGYYVSKKSDTELTIEGGVKADIFDMMFRKLGV